MHTHPQVHMYKETQTLILCQQSLPLKNMYTSEALGQHYSCEATVVSNALILKKISQWHFKFYCTCFWWFHEYDQLGDSLNANTLNLKWKTQWSKTDTAWDQICKHPDCQRCLSDPNDILPITTLLYNSVSFKYSFQLNGIHTYYPSGILALHNIVHQIKI